MKNEMREAFSEVYSLLNLYGDAAIETIPKKLYQMIEENRLKEYQPQYSLEVSLADQNLKRETIALLMLLYMNFWCESPDEKKELAKALHENSEKEHQKMREKYSSQNMFREINEAREKQRIAEKELHEVAAKVEEVSKENPKEGNSFFGKLFHK